MKLITIGSFDWRNFKNEIIIPEVYLGRQKSRFRFGIPFDSIGGVDKSLQHVFSDVFIKTKLKICQKKNLTKTNIEIQNSFECCC